MSSTEEEEVAVITAAMLAIGPRGRRLTAETQLRELGPYEPAVVDWGEGPRRVTDREGDPLDAGSAFDEIQAEIDRPGLDD